MSALEDASEEFRESLAEVEDMLTQDESNAELLLVGSRILPG